MRIEPHFTWEYILDRCHFYEDVPLRESHRQAVNGLLSAVPVIRAHPELGKLIPCMSLLGLTWWVSERHEVNLFCIEDKCQYDVSVCDLPVDKMGTWPTTPTETQTVPLETLAETLMHYINKYRDDRPQLNAES
jgi:hypothetical protein